MLLVLSGILMGEFIQVTKKMKRTDYYVLYCSLIFSTLCLILTTRNIIFTILAATFHRFKFIFD